MYKRVIYDRVPGVQCLGRNRYFETAGIDMFLVFDEAGKALVLEPRTGKNESSAACRIVIPWENVSDVAAALVESAELPKVEGSLRSLLRRLWA